MLFSGVSLLWLIPRICPHAVTWCFSLSTINLVQHMTLITLNDSGPYSDEDHIRKVHMGMFVWFSQIFAINSQLLASAIIILQEFIILEVFFSFFRCKLFTGPCLWISLKGNYLCQIISISAHSPSVCDLALFNLFISSVFNVVNTGDIIQVIFQRWRT